jgi:phage-related protein
MGDTLDVLRRFPAPVREEIGYALYLAQEGEKHPAAKALRGFGSGVLEVVARHPSGAFRAVYVVRLGQKVYVLHAFQKKSHKGVATPRHELQVVRQRLKRALELCAAEEE